MARGNKSFIKNTGVEVLAHTILHKKSNSLMRARSSSHGSLDGLNDVLSIIDELHAIERELFDVIISGMKKRRDSLLLCITTAGFNTDGVGHDQSQYAKKVATGGVLDETFFSAVYTIDEGDDIFSEVTWRKANPNYGISVDPLAFEQAALKAKVVPADLPNFKVKHLDIWISEAHAYFDRYKWDSLGDPGLKLESYVGKKCKVGIDLASKIDLTSIVYIFREDDGTYTVFDRSYIPEETVRQSNNSLYLQAISEGHLIQTKGEAIHYPLIYEEFKESSRKFRILDALYDPWAATEFAQKMVADRINAVEFRMNTANLSEPTKALDALIRQGKIRHNGSPLLSWCISNVVCKEDAAGNVYPRKSHVDLKIDPAIALIMALASWVQADVKTSVYETRGVLSF
jgi:phage terminase large subunit-like protein